MAALCLHFLYRPAQKNHLGFFRLASDWLTASNQIAIGKIPIVGTIIFIKPFYRFLLLIYDKLFIF